MTAVDADQMKQPAGGNLHQGISPKKCGKQHAELRCGDFELVLDERSGNREIAAVDVIDEHGQADQEQERVHAPARFECGRRRTL